MGNWGVAWGGGGVTSFFVEIHGFWPGTVSWANAGGQFGGGAKKCVGGVVRRNWGVFVLEGGGGATSGNHAGNQIGSSRAKHGDGRVLLIVIRNSFP